MSRATAVLAVLADGSFQDITSSEYCCRSANSGIVSIQNGIITGIAQGQVTISAQYQSFASDFEVRVTPTPDQLIGIEFEPHH